MEFPQCKICPVILDKSKLNSNTQKKRCCKYNLFLFYITQILIVPYLLKNKRSSHLQVCMTKDQKQTRTHAVPKPYSAILNACHTSSTNSKDTRRKSVFPLSPGAANLFPGNQAEEFASRTHNMRAYIHFAFRQQGRSNLRIKPRAAAAARRNSFFFFYFIFYSPCACMPATILNLSLGSP